MKKDLIQITIGEHTIFTIDDINVSLALINQLVQMKGDFIETKVVNKSQETITCKLFVIEELRMVTFGVGVLWLHPKTKIFIF